MKIKPVHIGLGIGAFLLWGGKKKGAGAKGDDDEVAKASAYATAQAAQEASGPENKAAVQQKEVKLLGEALLPGKVGEPPFGPANLPSPTELAVLWSIDSALVKQVIPADLLRPIVAQIKAFPPLEEMARRKYTADEKIKAALSLMTPSQTRSFAGDCIELAKPVFEKEFPGNKSVDKLIRGFWALTAKDPAMTAAKLGSLRDDVLDLIKTRPKSKSLAIFAQAVTFATITKENFSRLDQSFPGIYREKMVAALRETKDFAMKSLQQRAQEDVIQAWERENPVNIEAGERRPAHGPHAARTDAPTRGAEELWMKTGRGEYQATEKGLDWLEKRAKGFLHHPPL